MKVGFVGLGVMGQPMAQNLLKAGHELRVYNRSQERMQPLLALGAVAAGSPREAAIGAEAVITMVTDDAAVRAVTLGEEGTLSGLQPGTMQIDMSTISPGTTRELAEEAGGYGVAWLDAPVTGMDVGARSGTLTIMVGATAESFERAQPLFTAMGRVIVHAGPVGIGQTLKLASNLISGLTLMVAAEGLALGQALGIPQSVLDEVLPKSSAQSLTLDLTLERLRRDEWQPGFSVSNRLKDLRLALQMAEDAGCELVLAPQALAPYEDHARTGGAALDQSSYLRYVQARIRGQIG